MKKLIPFAVGLVALLGVSSAGAAELYYHGPAAAILQSNGNKIYGDFDRLCDEVAVDFYMNYYFVINNLLGVQKCLAAKYARFQSNTLDGSDSRGLACYLKSQTLYGGLNPGWRPDPPVFSNIPTAPFGPAFCEYPNSGLYSGKDGCFGTAPPEFTPNHTLCFGKTIPPGEGGIVACNGEEMQPCVFVENMDPVPSNPRVRQIVHACTMEHESSHIESAPETGYCHAESGLLAPFMESEAPNKMYYLHLSEFQAFSASKACYEREIFQCGNDQECISEINNRIFDQEAKKQCHLQLTDPHIPIEWDPTNLESCRNP